MKAANRDCAVRTVDAEMFDLADRRFVGVDKPIVRCALDMYWFV
jgi:hypothetical protein